MARNGLPKSGGQGYELFDDLQLGMTDFVQNLNFQFCTGDINLRQFFIFVLQEPYADVRSFFIIILKHAVCADILVKDMDIAIRQFLFY